MRKFSFHITGMDCASCALNIEKLLRDTEGIKKVEVNFATQTGNVEFDETLVNEEKIFEVVKSLGYEVSSAKKDGGEELKKLKSIFMFSLLFSIPVFVFSMIMPVSDIFFGGNEFLRKIVILALATPVQFIAGKRFYKATITSLRHRFFDMDVLIVVGTSTAYFYSLVNVFLGGDIYFETSALLITFVLMGKYLELLTRGKMGDAVRKLMNLAPVNAWVEREGKIVNREIYVLEK